MYYQKKRWTSAKKSKYNDYYYDSKFEAGYAMELDILLKAGEIKGYDKQVTQDLYAYNFFEKKPVKIGRYKPDFVVYHNDGTTEYIETKGRMSEEFKLRWRIFTAMHAHDPNVRCTLILQGKKQWNPRKFYN